MPTLTWVLLPTLPQSTDSIGSDNGIVIKTGSSLKSIRMNFLWRFLCSPTLAFNTWYFWRKCFFLLAVLAQRIYSTLQKELQSHLSSLRHREILKSFRPWEYISTLKFITCISGLPCWISSFFNFNFLTVRGRFTGFTPVCHEENFKFLNIK